MRYKYRATEQCKSKATIPLVTSHGETYQPIQEKFSRQTEIIFPATIVDDVKSQDQGFSFLPINDATKLLHLVRVADDRQIDPQVMFLSDGVKASHNSSCVGHQLGRRCFNYLQKLNNEWRYWEGHVNLKWVSVEGNPTLGVPICTLFHAGQR